MNSKMGELLKSFHKFVCIVRDQLWRCPRTSQNQRLVIHGSDNVPICMQSRPVGVKFQCRLTERRVEERVMAPVHFPALSVSSGAIEVLRSPSDKAMC